MTAQHGTTTTSSIGWYGSYTEQSGDYCEPFDQELYESQLRKFILIGSRGTPSSLFSESQHPCGTASFVYSKKNEAIVIPDYHAGYINEGDSGRVRPKNKYILEFELSGLTGDFFEANASSDSKYKITNTIVNRKPVYKKLYENWFIFYEQNRFRYILANSLSDYTHFLIGDGGPDNPNPKPNGIYRSLIDDDQVGFSEGVNDFSDKTTCEVEISYQVRNESGAYFQRKYNDYFETSELKGSATRNLTESTHLPSSCFLDVKNLELSTEIGRGFGTSVNPKFTKEYSGDCNSTNSLQITYEADVDVNCDISAIEKEYINEGERIVDLVERYDANYSVGTQSIDEIISNKSLYLGSNPPKIISESNQKYFSFDGTNYITINSLISQSAINNNEFSIFLKHKPTTDTQSGVLLSRWKTNESMIIHPKSTFMLHTDKMQTFKNTNIYSMNKPDKDVWHNVLITFNKNAESDNLKIYLDNQTAIAFNTTEEEFIESTLPIAIGGFLTTNGTLKNGYVGLINDVRFYNRSLTESEKSELFLGNDYDTNRKKYDVPVKFDKTLYEDLFYENTETILEDIDLNHSDGVEILDMQSMNDVLAVSYIENEKYYLEFYFNQSTTFKFLTEYPINAKFRIKDDKLYVCYTNKLIIRNLFKNSDGAVVGTSRLTELQSFIHNDFFDVSESGKFIFVTRNNEGSKIVTTYLLKDTVLTPHPLSGGISNVTGFSAVDDLVVLTLSGKTMILYKEVDDAYEIKWLQEIPESETILNSEIIRCGENEQEKYFIASRYKSTDLANYSDRYKSSLYIENQVGFIKLRKIKNSLTKLDGLEIEPIPFQTITPPYDVYGNGFLDSEDFGTKLGFYDDFLLVTTPQYKTWCYQYSSSSEKYIFVTALKSEMFQGNFVSSQTNSIYVNTKSIGNEALFKANTNKVAKVSFQKKLDSELISYDTNKLNYQKYGHNLKAWYRFGDDFVQKQDQFVVIDRSGNYNHMNCFLRNSSNEFVSPFDNKFLGPYEADESILLNADNKMDFGCELIGKSFSINIWYMVTSFNVDGYDVILSSKNENTDTENGFCILADGRTMIGNKILGDFKSVTNTFKWTMATICYDHTQKQINHYINAVPSVWYDTEELKLDNNVFRIGQEFKTINTNSFLGYLDDIKVYEGVLSPELIQDEFKKTWKYEWLK